MPTVYMNGSSASTAGKRKRMPGANHENKPEIKAYDPFHNVADVGEYNAIDIVNLSRVAVAEQVNFKPGNFPYGLGHPVQGDEANQRIGNRYFLKFLKFKGYIYCRRTNPWTARWRLVLIRTSNVPAATFINNYYTFYQNADTRNPTDLAAVGQNDVMSHARHNYYKKMTEPANNNIFRRKVICSGVIPAIYQHEMSNQLALSGSPALIKTTLMTTPGITNNTACWIPINVTVKCNDNIDVTTDKYWIVFENDVGTGFDHNEAWILTGTGSAFHDCRDDANIDYRVFGANFYCKAYFTDR